jgi:hypothetical protein
MKLTSLTLYFQCTSSVRSTVPEVDRTGSRVETKGPQVLEQSVFELQIMLGGCYTFCTHVTHHETWTNLHCTSTALPPHSVPLCPEVDNTGFNIETIGQVLQQCLFQLQIMLGGGYHTPVDMIQTTRLRPHCTSTTLPVKFQCPEVDSLIV